MMINPIAELHPRRGAGGDAGLQPPKINKTKTSKAEIL